MKIVSIEKSNIMSIESMVDSIDEVLTLGEELSELETISATLCTDMNLLKEIRTSIEECGITPDIEYLFGESLSSSGINLSDAECACEGITDTIKAIARKVWQFIVSIITKVKVYYAKYFGSFKKRYDALKSKHKQVSGSDAKRKIKTKEKNEHTTISAKTLDKKQIEALFSTTKENGTIKFLADMLDKAESGDEIKFDGSNGLYTVDTDTDDEGVYTYKLESNLDDLLDSDRRVIDVIPKNGKNADYVTFVGNAKEVAKDLSSGKVYSSVEKKYNKISNKAEKNAKNADYDDDAKVTATNVRNGLAIINKIIKLELKRYDIGMTTLLAVPLQRI